MIGREWLRIEVWSGGRSVAAVVWGRGTKREWALPQISRCKQRGASSSIPANQRREIKTAHENHQILINQLNHSFTDSPHSNSLVLAMKMALLNSEVHRHRRAKRIINHRRRRHQLICGFPYEYIPLWKRVANPFLNSKP